MSVKSVGYKSVGEMSDCICYTRLPRHPAINNTPNLLPLVLSLSDAKTIMHDQQRNNAFFSAISRAGWFLASMRANI